MIVLVDECDHAGLDRAKVASIARRLTKAARDAHAIGLVIFGGSGYGSLRWADPDERNYRLGALIVAHLGGQNFDGGDGGEHCDEHGLTRGENA